MLMLAILSASFISRGEDLDYQILERNLKLYQDKIVKLKSSIDQTVFNGEKMLINMDFEAQQVIDFMHDKVVFQPYQGLLRGVQGTLNARAGNALDQSVLLASLLNDAGMQTRIATAQLNSTQSLQLLGGFKSAELPQHIGLGDDFEQALAQLNHNNKKINWSQTVTAKRYEQALKTLTSTLQKQGVQLPEKDITKQLLNDSREYFWVEYRLGQSDDWQAAHPALLKGDRFEVQASTYFSDQVPAGYHHQLRVEAFIEQKINDQHKTHALMKAWQKPVANLQNVLITYSNAPSGLRSAANADFNQIIDNSTYFTPMFNGRAVGTQVFDLKGRVIDAEAMQSQMGALFQTLGDKTLSAIDGISDKKQPAMQLVAHWLQFTFIQPNGDEYVQKRYIYHQSDSTNDFDAKLSMITEYALLVNSGEKPLAYLSKVYFDMIEESFPLLKGSVKVVFDQGDVKNLPRSYTDNEFALLTQYQWMNSDPYLSDQTIRYRDGANLIGFKRGYVNKDKAFMAVDIIRNKQRFITHHKGQYLIDGTAAMQHGVWETAGESLPAKILKLNGKGVDTLSVSEAAQSQNIPWQVIKTQNDVLQLLNISDQTDKQMMKTLSADIEMGYWVVMPKQKPDEELLSAWWRINPHTGETLGMTADGGGQSATEYAIELAAQALFLVRAIGNLKKCDEKTNNLEKLCCLAEAHFNNVGGLAFGGILGASIGTAGAAVFDIVDFTAELATGSGIAPSTNGKLCAGIDYPDF